MLITRVGSSIGTDFVFVMKNATIVLCVTEFVPNTIELQYAPVTKLHVDGGSTLGAET